MTRRPAYPAEGLSMREAADIQRHAESAREYTGPRRRKWRDRLDLSPVEPRPSTGGSDTNTGGSQ